MAAANRHRDFTAAAWQQPQLTGSRFQGISQASGGNFQDSSTNYPVVQLRAIDNSQVAFLPVDPIAGWSDTSFTSAPVNNFSSGPALVTVFTNGIPSDAKYVLVASPSPTCDSGLIINGGFETGTFPPWVVDGTANPPIVTSANPHSGTFSALAGNLSGGEPLGDSSFYQQFVVPAGGGTLSFWHWDFTTDNISYDWQDAYITDSNGNILLRFFHQCANGQTWINTTTDLMPFAGQTVRIKFLVHQDGFGDDTAMYVDDVQLLGPCGSPPPTPTATATATATFTPTPEATATATATFTPTPEPTATATATSRLRPQLRLLQQQRLPPQPQPQPRLRSRQQLPQPLHLHLRPNQRPRQLRRLRLRRPQRYCYATATATSTPTPTPAPPAAPKALNDSNETANSFTANWTSVSGATSYRLDVSTSNTFVTYVTIYHDLDVGNVTSRNVTGLTANTFYYYRVRAFNGNTSLNSNVIKAKTKAH